MKQNNFFIMALMIIGIMSLIMGCSVPGNIAGKNDESILVNSPEINKSGSFDSYHVYYDASGRIELRYYYKSAFGDHNTATATVEDGYLCIGGGAFVDLESGDPAMLTGSWPSLDMKSWNAQSKDHIYYGWHRLVSVAIGMRLKDANGRNIDINTIKSHFSVNNSVIFKAHTTEQSITVTPNTSYSIISGGANITVPFENPGQFLRQSSINTNYGGTTYWIAKSNSNTLAYMKNLFCYTITYDNKDIAGFGRIKVSIKTAEGGKTPAFTKGEISMSPDSGWLISSVGAYTAYKDLNYNRMLSAIGMFAGVGFIHDENVIYPYPSSITMTMKLIQIQKL
jgi:hypothetical protein